MSKWRDKVHPAAFDVADEAARWGKIVHAAGIEPQ